MKPSNTTSSQTYHTTSSAITWNGLTLTDAAIQQILTLKHKDPNMLGIKITIKKSGCAGFTYLMEKVTSLLNHNYLTYERNGAKLFIPLNVMPFIDGTELDYIQNGLNCMFKFNNPQAQYSCGCGESFGIQ